MDSSGHVDWLAVTFPASVTPKYTLPPASGQPVFTPEGHPVHGYRYRAVNEFGASVLFGGEKRLGTHLVLSGQALANIRRAGLTDRELCQYALTNDGKLTRLDVAINLYEANLSPQELAFSFEKGALSSPAHSGLLMTGVRSQGQTFVLGSGSSDRYLRAYDKAAEQGIPDMRWLRIELELKKWRARGLAHVISIEENTRGVINRAVGDYLKMPDNEELSQALSDQAGDIPQEGRKLHDTLKWLGDQVAPAMAQYQVSHPDEDVLGWLTVVYGVELRKRQQAGRRGEDVQEVSSDNRDNIAEKQG